MTIKAIGATFEQELKAAGLLGLPFSWGADGKIEFRESMTDAQIAAVNAVYEAHDPSKQDFTAAAQAALAKSDMTIIRCAENSIPVPSAWATYRAALRAIIVGKQSGPLPSVPAFPANT
jgi:hypothetical protein